jgi:hypothetical protein
VSKSTFCQIEFGQPKSEIKPMLHFNYRKLGHCHNMSINACEWEMTTLDAGLELAAETLHRECPVSPDQPPCLYPVSDVEKGMYCEQAG